MLKYFIQASLILLVFFFFSSTCYAASENYVTVVNPVRNRKHWQNIQYLKDQLTCISEKNFSSTWLIQPSALSDSELIEVFLNESETSIELGLFMEIDEDLATASKVSYLIGEGDWARPDKIFLSGYSLQERKRLVDESFNRFKKVFGFYPKSVGAWYIDSFSLQYMSEKYKIRALLDCADQYVTDKYGIWGKPWSVPFYPSRYNSLIPSSKEEKSLGVVAIQWAQRDPVRGWGLDINSSTYSLQANDYKGHHNLGIEYFIELVDGYLSSPNKVNHITLGLEVGQEGNSFKKGFQDQLDHLSELEKKSKIKSVTMSEFADTFNNNTTDDTTAFIHGSDFFTKDLKTFWYYSPYYRLGLMLKDGQMNIIDLRIYNPPYIFYDFLISDNSVPMQKFLPSLIDQLVKKNSETLVKNVKSVNFKRQGNNIVLLCELINGESIITLDPQTIYLDEKVIHKTHPLSISERIVLKSMDYLMKALFHKDHTWHPSYRYSKINNDFYIGLWTSPERFYGVKSSYPFGAKIDADFQTLSKFKKFPPEKLKSSIAGAFIDIINTIFTKKI